MRDEFLRDYTLKASYLISPDPARAVPGIRPAIDGQGEPFLIKHWKRGPEIPDEPARALWLNELRQLYRIASRPAIEGCITRLHASGEDRDGYYVVLSAGLRVPLRLHSQAERIPAALRPHAKALDRMWLWRNLTRVAKALDALHEHNIVHRNISLATILTVGRGDPDFQLSGLERSIPFLASAHQCVPRNSEFHPLDDSFAGDWRRFGAIVGTLMLGMDVFKLRDNEMTTRDVAPQLAVSEVQLLKDLAMIDRGSQIDGVTVLSRLDEILQLLERTVRREEGRPVVVISLGATRPVSAAIAAATDIEVDDVEGQLAYIENDLSHDVGAVAVGGPDQFSLLLRGARFNYHLVDYQAGSRRVPSNWAVAFCQRVSPATYRSQRILDQRPIDSVLFQVVPVDEVSRYLGGRASQSSFWLRLRASLLPALHESTEADIQNRAFVLTQILESLIAAANEFPVEVVGSGMRSSRASEQQFYVRVRARDDANRAELSRIVGYHERIGRRLRQALADELSIADAWILRSDPPGPIHSNAETRWRAIKDEEHDDPTAITFVGDRPVSSTLQNAVLVRTDATGTQGQLRRRLKALSVLDEHPELSHVLCDPNSQTRLSHEFISVEPTDKLDPDKRIALKGALQTMPLYLVQGPPGVGKTRLVSELIKRVFRQNSSERVLFSAQSHSAIDHLRKEVVGLLPAEAQGGPLVVRCRNSDDEKIRDPQELPAQAEKVMRSVAGSALFEFGPPVVKARLQVLLQSESPLPVGCVSEGDVSREYHRGPIEDLVLKAANVVFATSNSAELEELLDDGAQFDWSIIEEAAKATGGELVGALLLSHRRLLIGDHQQLPPFDAERMRTLLASDVNVRRALALAQNFARVNLRDSQVTAFLNEFSADGDELDEVPLSRLRDSALRNFFLFESLFVAEEARCRKTGTHSRIAKELLFQHRMRPALARLISRAFYRGRLKTDPGREREFAATRSPVYSINKRRLPNRPLVWVDMPWKSRARHARGGEEYPIYHNSDERRAVIQVCHLLRAEHHEQGAPSLALLSPYAEQVKRLRQLARRPSSELGQLLRRFSSPSADDQYVHTVDSFQGNEADIVIVSLVRNNSHASIKASLGFIANAQRMNVLLSRARHRLILIGSLAFIQEVAGRTFSDGSHLQIEFLREFLKGLRAAESAGDARIVEWATLRAGAHGSH